MIRWLFFVPLAYGIAASDQQPAFAQQLRDSLSFCASISDAERRLACFDEAVGSLPPPTPATSREEPVAQSSPPAAASPSPPTHQWLVREERDAMTDQPSVFLSLVSQPDTTAAVLTLRCQRNRTELFITTDEYLGSVDRLPVMVRMGSRPAQNQSWSPSSSGKGVFSPNSIPMIREIMQSDSMLVEISPRIGGRLRMRFVTAGLGGVVSPLQSACGWR